MGRSTIIAIDDVVVQIVALLVVLLCAKNIFAALRNEYVFIYGKKATRGTEPVGYWLVIVSWIVILAVFASTFV